jgi:PAS domain S-box-containing protein
MPKDFKIRPGEEEQRYNRLLRYLTDYIYTVHVEKNKVVYTYHGPGCVAVTGYTSDDLHEDADLWHSMVHEDDKAAVLERADRALKGIEVEPLEHRIIHRDGTVRWVRSSIVLSKDGNGNLLYYDGLINDITELKKAQQRTETKQRQLIQADKMVSLGTMVTGIAHEISNPTNFVLLNARFLQKAWDDIFPVIKEYADRHEDYIIAGYSADRAKDNISQSTEGIVNGALRIQKITKSLTNFARSDAGEINHAVDINTVTANAVMLTGNIIKNSTDHFSVNYNKSLPIIKGNPQQLEQVLINLISNACQSLRSKEEAISVDLKSGEDEKSISIVISDEGAGIEKDHLKHIFDPFFTTKRDSGGTGLGLYVSYKIIEGHMGDLIITSEKNKGTTCEVILPIN